ncbi:hypothetical protein JR316_0003917 [Psilocybe cubensis]|uniref:Protein kinase domain-containing protein n=2 Tax=Psilocybe cubensis TaxID=181762 RepID=A0A8H7Y5V8_PSICU|nr:hypothetical protein JR316_0003917 [Psilocybe cubensis]KAH9484435.1 hypothetical protein JR316_0003917 [Psilocybe cubensis]
MEQSNSVLIFLKNEFKEISAELKHRMFKNDAWADSLLANSPFPKDDIQRFLHDSPLYDGENKRWKHLKRNVINEHHLTGPLSEIIRAIIYFGGLAETRDVRFEKEIDGLQLRNRVREEDIGETDQLRVLPDITICGFGASFSSAAHVSKYNVAVDLSIYTNCVTPIHVKPNSYVVHTSERIQMALYARQCFKVQQNRNFVYSLFLTEESAQLFLFDRSGCWYSRQIDIHKEAIEFVCLVLAISSKDEAQIGIDPCISWSEDKSQGYIKLDKQCEDTQIYEILNNQPRWRHNGLIGNGTCCWLARDPEGKLVVVKDSWIPVPTGNRVAEAHVLDSLKSAGLAQGISKIREFNLRESYPASFIKAVIDGMSRGPCGIEYQAKRHSRIIVEYAGVPLSDIEDAKSVLIAMRSAIAAHQQLWNYRVLHRDISISNILLDNNGQGTLIDFSEAIWLENENLVPDFANHNTGTRPFQSTIVLRSLNDRTQRTTHDYFDDLESFFHVLCYIALRNECAKEKPISVHASPIFIRPWNEETPSLEAISKEALFRDDNIWKQLNASAPFGGVFGTLLSRYREHLKPMVLQRLDAAESIDDPDTQRPTYKELRQHSNIQYPMVLALFDDAIKAL